MKNTLLLFLFAAIFCLKTNAQEATALFGPADGYHSFNDLIYHFGLNPNSKNPRIKSLPELRDSLGRFLVFLEKQEKKLGGSEYNRAYDYYRFNSIKTYWEELKTFCTVYLPKGKFKQDAFLNSRPKKYDYYATNAYESNTKWLYILGILNKNELYIDWAITYIERSADGSSLDAAAFYLEWVDTPNRDIAKRAYGYYYLLQNLNYHRDYKKAAYYNQLLHFLLDNKKTLQKQSPARLYKYVNQDTSNLYQSILSSLSSKFEGYISDVDSSYRQGNYMVSLDSFLSMDFKSQKPNAFNSAALLLQEQYRNPPYKGSQESLDLERIHFFYKYSVENSKPQKLEWLLRKHIHYFKIQVGNLPDSYATEVSLIHYLDKYRAVANVDSLMLELFEKVWVEAPDSVIVEVYNLLQPYLYYQTDRFVLNQSIAATEGLTSLAFQLQLADWFESQNDSLEKVNQIYIHLLNQKSLINEGVPLYIKALIPQKNYFDPETFEEIIATYDCTTLYHLIVEKYLNFYLYNNDAKVARDSSLLLPFKVGYLPAFALVDSIPEHLIVAGFLSILNYQLKQYPKDTANFLKWELKRLEKMHQFSWLENRDELYANALRSLYEQYKGTKQGLNIGLLLVQKLSDFGQPYEDAPHEYPYKRWLWKDASDFAFELGKVYKKDYRVDDIIYKIRNLNKQRLGLTVESFVLANQPFKILAKNRSIDTIFVEIYPQHFKEFSDYQTAIYATDSLPIFTFNIPNLNHGDLREHLTELPMPALPAGQYSLKLGYKDYEKDLHVEEVSVTVSNIMLIPHNKNSKDSISYYAVHRHNGQPLANARVSVYAYQRDTVYFVKDSTTTDYYPYKDTVIINKITEHLFAWEFYGLSDEFGKITFPNKRCCNHYDDYGNYLNSLSHYKKVGIRYLDDSLYVDNSVRTNDLIYPTEPIVYHGHLFTDRAIYRPGQTVYFKGLITDGEGQTVWNTKSDGYYLHYFNVTVELTNSRGEYIKDRYLEINQFGTFSDSIEIPITGITGEYTLKIKDVYIDKGDTSYTFLRDSLYNAHANYMPATFNVEEYKRPTFETTFLPLEKYYAVTDLVPVKGTCKAYAGYPIANAKISYKVECEVNFPDRWWFDWEDGHYDDNGYFIPKYKRNKVIATGNTTSNDLGEFTISFRGERHSNHNEYAEYNYTVEAVVTDVLTGETQTSKYDVRLCEQALNVRLDVPEELFANQDYNLALTIEDAAQKAVNTQANLRIYKLKTPAAPKHLPIWERPTSFVLSQKEHDVLFPNLPYTNEYEIYNWEKGEAVFSFAFNPTQQADYLLKKGGLAEGDYVAELEVFDSIQNRPILVKRYFKYFDLNKKDCQVSTPIWMYVDKTTVNIGDTLNFHFASAKKEVYALLRIEQNTVLLYKKWIKINGKTIESIVIPNRFKGDVHYYLDIAMDNRNYSKDGHIDVLYSPTKVQIEFLSFRDKLLPGQKERWEWTIKDQFGKPLKAEMLATLYDASLDVMRRNRFVINSPFKKYANYELAFDWESLFDLVYSGGAYTYSYDTIVTFDPETFEEPVSVVANSSEPEKFKLTKFKPNNSPKAQKQNAIRTNLKETIFFKPHLQTDKDGKIVLEFTMNEALTRWRLMLLAHTNQVEYAISERTIVTQKEIMVQPNVPRFVRVGDELVFTAKVVNLTKEAKKGIATLEILDPATMKAIKVFLPKVHFKQKFDLEAQKSGQVSWKIKIPAGYEHLVYRVIAKSGKMADGEQNKFAILPNTMLATENTPINLVGGQSQNYDLKTLLPITNGQQSEAYGLELTTNPAWDAIRGLSYMMEYSYHCSEQLLNRYYANSLAAAVFQSNPKVSETFKKWRIQGLGKHKLLKNNEIREVLLAESPWLASAVGESEIRQRLSLLFDLDSMRSRQDIVLDMLKERQNGNGGFSWYGGEESSLYISQYVLENLGHLKQLTGDQFPKEKTAAILSSASHYVDKVVQKNYTDWMRYIKEVGADTNRFELDELNIHYLYARSFIPMDSSTAVPFNFVLEQAWRKRNDFIKNDYLTGLLCLALHRNGKKTEALQLVDSLRNHATVANNIMYWQKTSGYYWYQNCLETQALMVEVFHEVAQDPKAVQAMKTWLIQQKSDNYWNSTKATSAAVYALLIGNNWLSDSQVPTITVNDKTLGITEENLEPGTGYFKQRWEKQDIEQIAITNNNKEVPIYGNIYHQYYTPLDQIKVVTDANACHLRKLIYKVIYTDKGDSLALVTDKTILNTGDKLRIKLQFYAPKALEFLHLKDQRPASCEPTEQLSGYRYQNGIGYYQSLRDASSNFFIESLSKGKHELVYDMLVNQKGRFQSGYSMLQSMYAPEYTVYDRSVLMRVE